MAASDFFSYEVRSGEPYPFGNLTLTPFARTLEVRFPGLQGGLQWSTPASVLVQADDGREEVIQIRDVTRIVQVLLLLTGALGALLLLRMRRD